MHRCPDCGLEHEHSEPEVVIEEAPDVEPVAEASVEIARIEAERDVQVAKIANKGSDEETASLIAALQARLDVLEQSRLAPEPEVVPVIVDTPEPEPEIDGTAEAPPAAEHRDDLEQDKPAKKKNPWVSQY